MAMRLVALQVTDATSRVVRTWLIRGSWMTLDALMPVLQTMWPELCCVLVTRSQEDDTEFDSDLAIPVSSGLLRLLTDLTAVLGIHDEPPVTAGRKSLQSLMWWLTWATLLGYGLLAGSVVVSLWK